ncbi:FAD binding domain-containing protein [Desulfotalea psychrophila]|uniref:Probable oxidoreductase (Molybdopterin binding subunit) n=1 Tax=Desulfotalea psychrophila (strain LSv54 / DSM 12343) TaxID=177439 RepID=Q6AMH2_DESPS|nr:FAD binding domain-containing protein [Desulfotalea psychrophila]CAG36453.1 probable oxidoreductase (molybdopterin binding subunit) [Desulfotalea psychrophila LSv54]
MKPFNHINASSLEEASKVLIDSEKKACCIAGGTDLLGCLKDELWLEYPETVVNLKTIPGLDAIREDEDGLHIGALVKLTELAESPLVLSGYAGLAHAASKTASILLRNMGTVAGNICQENRCWYYRYPDKLGGKIPCIRKGGKKCLAVPGDHRFHSIFGQVNRCIAVNPSDTAPAFVALGAVVKTTLRDIPIAEFFSAEHGKQSTVLEPGEIVREIFVPKTAARSAFTKIAYRKSIDFALLNCAVALCFDGELVTSARICLNGVFNNPKSCPEAEEFLIGKKISEETARQAGELALATAKPTPQTAYKVPIAERTVADTILMAGV